MEISTFWEAFTWSVQKETKLVKQGANEPTQLTRDSGAV
jgi:hypothetical protein